jgi:hypothetical protein
VTLYNDEDLSQLIKQAGDSGDVPAASLDLRLAPRRRRAPLLAVAAVLLIVIATTLVVTLNHQSNPPAIAGLGPGCPFAETQLTSTSAARSHRLPGEEVPVLTVRADMPVSITVTASLASYQSLPQNRLVVAPPGARDGAPFVYRGKLLANDTATYLTNGQRQTLRFLAPSPGTYGVFDLEAFATSTNCKPPAPPRGTPTGQAVSEIAELHVTK